MSTYDETMQPTLPTLKDGEKEHVLCPQDECLASTNDAPQRSLLNSQSERREMDMVSISVGGLAKRQVI